MLKAGIILAVLGGAPIGDESGKDNPFKASSKERTKSNFRADSHILLIGDPGLGKSQLLKFVSSVTPRSVYVCGNACSSAGLTVCVSKDAASGESTLEVSQ
jgi:DNA helicase MCM8